MMMMMMMRVMTASSPRSAQLTPSAVYGRFGHPLDLNCRASRNTKPPPRVTWFKDGVAVVISDRLQIDSTRSRSLSRLSHKGGGDLRSLRGWPCQRGRSKFKFDTNVHCVNDKQYMKYRQPLDYSENIFLQV